MNKHKLNPHGMKKNHLPLAGLLILFLIAAGCVPSRTLPPPVSSTAGTAQILTQTMGTNPDEEVLYFEDFDDPSEQSGWDAKTRNENSTAVKKTGAYHFQVDRGELAAFLRGQDFNDTILTVDLEFLGPDPAMARIFCRNGAENYYFSISSQGHWQIDSSANKLSAGDTSALKAGVNKIKVACIGSQLSLALNEVELGVAQDGAFTQGEIGLGLESIGKAEIVFDNLSVRKPGSQAGPDPTPIVDVTATPSVTQTPLPLITPLPLVTLIPSPTPDGLFYANTFNGPDAGFDDWIIHADAIFPRHDNQDPAYTFAINAGQNLVLDSTVSQPLYAIYDELLPETSQVVAAEMEFKGEGEGSLALICRYSVAGWYELGISNSGHWSISLVQGGTNAGLQRTIFAKGDSGAILPAKNKIEASCRGQALILSVNGTKIGSAEDGTVEAGRIAGVMYQEAVVGENRVELASFVVTGSDGSHYLDLHAAANSFYFYIWKFLASSSVPGDISALFIPKASIITEDGRARITTNRPMRWIALYPQKLPYNIEVSVDVDVQRTDPFDSLNDQGFGLVCRWLDQPAAFIDQNTGGYVLWLLRTYVIVTPFRVDEFGNAQSTGTAEFSDNTSFIQLLEGNQHHLMARCWNDRVDFYVDGKVVAQRTTSSFPYSGNNKVGYMAGLMFLSGDVAQYSNYAAVAKFTSAGSIDITFDGDGRVIFNLIANSRALACAVDSNGKLVVVGEAKPGGVSGTSTDLLVFRLNTNGSLDTSFNGVGYLTKDGASTFAGTNESSSGVLIGPGNEIYVTGWGSDGAFSGMTVWKFSQGGVADASFGLNGVFIDFTNATVTSGSRGINLSFATNGSLLVAGSRTNMFGAYGEVAVWNLTSTNGTLISSPEFPAGVLTWSNTDMKKSWARKALIDSSNRLVILGGADDAAGVNHMKIWRYSY